jgi:competence ComEA-like helix-hairpin-helix protein
MTSLFKVVLLILAVGTIWAIQHRYGPALPPPQEPSLESGLSTESYKLNLNAASVQELESLFGVGPKLAEAIIRFREDHGDFTALDQLKEVEGIGEKRFATLSKLLTVDESRSSNAGTDE